jgi:hypothetical protein
MVPPSVTESRLGVESKAELKKRYVGTKVSVARKWKNTAIVYVAGPISSCSRDAKLPGMKRKKAVTPIVYLYRDVKSDMVSTPLPLAEVYFDPKSQAVPYELYARGPLILTVSDDGIIRDVVEPFRIETPDSIIALTRFPS